MDPPPQSSLPLVDDEGGGEISTTSRGRAVSLRIRGVELEQIGI